VLASNRAHLERYAAALGAYRKVAIVGLTFKSGVDDLRGSPLVDLVRLLGARGVAVVGIDPQLKRERLVDVNRALFDELTSLPLFTLADDFDGDEEAVLFSFGPPGRVPAGARVFTL
jgi:GDP-mannose 6-dehydrogenase